MLKNDRVLRALLREPVDRTPIWLMRQAGRYLPEYRQTRARAESFLDLCRSPDLCTEVALQPIVRYGFDAAILFSDILTLPDAMGLGLRFVEGEGPRFEQPLREEWAIRNLSPPDPELELGYVLEAVRMIKRALADEVPLIGFAGSPWTLACYMVEGAGNSDFTVAKQMAFSRPDLMHRILQVNATAVADYLNAQIAAGADAVMLFDTWGGVLSEASFIEFSLKYLELVCARLTRTARGRRVPVIVFVKGGGVWLKQIAECGADAIGVDWTIDLGRARAQVGDRVALQGNLDPVALLAPPERVAQEAVRVLESYGEGPGHVFNLGHGVLPETPPEHVAVLVETVQHQSGRFHRSPE
ncbi:MAG: uroporphyrinogen decarboxylase [Hydrogenophilus sp.]|nr:uroporphyrinogen decarboxylase [Hydrogenophilus sp.]